MAKHSIEAGFQRGIFWRQAQFVENGEPQRFLDWNKIEKLRNEGLTEADIGVDVGDARYILGLAGGSQNTS